MIGTAMIVAGTMMMAAPGRRSVTINPLPGDLLREAYAAAAAAPVPEDMQRLARRIGSPLRVVGGRAQS